MFERFTDKARTAVIVARAEASDPARARQQVLDELRRASA